LPNSLSNSNSKFKNKLKKAEFPCAKLVEVFC
jgi:hypothetical protein